MPVNRRGRDPDARGAFDPRFDRRDRSASNFDRRDRPASTPVPKRNLTVDRPANSSGGPDKRTKSLSEIKSRLLRPALTSNYICKFSPPQPVKDWTAAKGTPYTRDNQELIELSCAEAALPGSSLMTHEANNDFTGVTERHAYRRAYDERASFTFMVDHDYTIIKFFENWMSYIVGEQFATTPNIEDPEYFYRVRYPKDYQTNDLYITKFERDHDYTGTSLQYRFLKAFPISIVTMPVRYDASELLKCTVNFTYSRYIIVPEKETPTSNGPKKETTNVNLNDFLGVPLDPVRRPATFPESPFRIIQNNFDNPIV